MDIMALITTISENWKELLAGLIGLYTALVTVASIIVKITPTLKDDDKLKGFIKFMGKYIALNR